MSVKRAGRPASQIASGLHSEERNRDELRAAYQYAAAVIERSLRDVAAVNALPTRRRLDLTINLATVAAVVIDLQEKQRHQKPLKNARARRRREAAELLRLSRKLIPDLAPAVEQRLRPPIAPGATRTIRQDYFHVRVRVLFQGLGDFTGDARDEMIGRILGAVLGRTRSLEAVRRHYERIPQAMKRHGFPELERLRLLSIVRPPSRDRAPNKVLPFSL